ncbi:MAG: serine/threonine-protein phosphatase [Gammaproteobacteria bacterium]|nr:serine/threonine-protein phosphatase [Gammaproteobacteria bacterium]
MSDPGKVRDVNEDAQLDRSDAGLWVVADGMGGHDAGDVASNMIVDTLAQLTVPPEHADFLDAVEDALMDVNKRLFAAATEGDEHRTIGSTVVAMIVREDYALILWAGDSRAYRLRDQRLQRITRDHSQVEEMIELGELLREDAETHPLANVITRAVGGEDDLRLDFCVERILDADRYLLCSDGLFKDVSEPEIEQILSEGSGHEAASKLVETVLEREAADNITVQVIDFSSIEASAEAAVGTS